MTIINSPIIGAGNGGATIKSIQSGSTTMSSTGQNQSISEIDQSKAVLIFSARTNSSTYEVDALVRGHFSTDTNIRFERGSSNGSAYMEWMVVEFEEGVSVQSGTGAIDDDQTDDYTIDSVDLDKSFVVGSFKQVDHYSSDANDIATTFELTSNTNVRAKREGTSQYRYPLYSFFVVEFE